MHLIRIEIIDKKFALISTMKIKNALELMMGGVGGVGGGEEERRRFVTSRGPTINFKRPIFKVSSLSLPLKAKIDSKRFKFGSQMLKIN